jgi:mandelate racemase
MKITGFRTRAVSVPAQYPVVSSVRATSQIEFVLLDVDSDEGVSGISYVQAFNRYGCQAVQQCLYLLEQVAAGRTIRDAADIEQLGQSLWSAVKLLGQQGLAAFAVSMIDIALWDMLGKRRGLPVCSLLGGSLRSLNAYCSEGMWLVSPQEAAEQAASFAERGFTRMKMRLGRGSESEDIQAVREVRAAIGGTHKLMADVNQGWTVEHTLHMGDRLEPFGLAWLEEPIDAEDDEGHAKLTSSLTIPIATGENLYRLRSTRRYLRMNAAAIYTPDLQRIGGITGWRQLQHDFEAAGAAYSVHLFPEYAVHLLAAADADTERGPGLEWMSWASALFQQPLQCIDGKVEVPDRPGFGMEWDEEKLAGWIMI